MKNWSSNSYGDRVCLSGATSGLRCGTIVDDATTAPGLSGNFYIRTKADSGWMSAGGDSGGPWYTGASGGNQARGIHYGGETAVSCGAIAPDVSPSWGTCTQFSWYVPISVVLNTWGLALEVG